jgi:hypothetical protein
VVWTNFEVKQKVVRSFQMAQKLGSGWQATLKNGGLELSKLRKKASKHAFVSLHLLIFPLTCCIFSFYKIYAKYGVGVRVCVCVVMPNRLLRPCNLQIV